MRSFFLLLSGLFLSSLVWAHGGHLATFSYQVESKRVSLTFTIDNATLDHFNMEESCANYKLTKALCLASYVNQKASLLADGKSLVFELVNSSQDDLNFTVHLVATGNFSSVETFVAKNSCFYEFDARFENRIIFEKAGSKNSYRLKSGHDEIEIR